MTWLVVAITTSAAAVNGAIDSAPGTSNRRTGAPPSARHTSPLRDSSDTDSVVSAPSGGDWQRFAQQVAMQPVNLRDLPLSASSPSASPRNAVSPRALEV